MIVNLKIYDADLDKLIKSIDKEARNFDSAKYGLPPGNNCCQIRNIVYNWLAKNNRKEVK